jgi:hypothetical protein
LIPQNPLSDFDTNLHQLNPLQGRTPDWSPNDRFISFESKRGCRSGNYAIFIEAAVTGSAGAGDGLLPQCESLSVVAGRPANRILG